MLLFDCVQRFFRGYLVRQRGYGTNTVASYRDTFRLLVSFLGEGGARLESLEMADLGKSSVTDFLCWLEGTRGNSVSTRNVRLAHLRSFAAYAMSISPEDAGACVEVLSLRPKREVSAPPDALSVGEVRLLLASPGTDTPMGLRDTALLTLLYDSACRAQELADMDVCDLALRPPCTARVLGKGRKARDIPLLDETGELLAAYVEAFSLGSGSPLFLNRSGMRLTRAGVSNVVERHWARVVKSHPEEVSHAKAKPHLLRHSKATHLVDENVNIYHVRDFLGHASVTTTQVYLKSNPRRMREAIETAAESTVMPGADYYSPDKKAELLAFLDMLA
ncbi:MAG: tyrosine-type recombinase/integrase [Atopobiaceae bacterium]|nr:tyrosine-type recombinase/integrase [Atopobiaceae bacterium]